MTDFAWDPRTYLDLMAEEIPDYVLLQQETVTATQRITAPRRILELGVGSGETARRVLAVHPTARLVGIDASASMLAAAGTALADHDVSLAIQRLEDPLPAGPFDLVVSVLAVHHLDGAGKADLFQRVRAVVARGGSFILGDLIVPTRPEDVVTPIDGVEDQPSSVAEQLTWLREAGFDAEVSWLHRDLAVLTAAA